jgi:hypothetical protein
VANKMPNEGRRFATRKSQDKWSFDLELSKLRLIPATDRYQQRCTEFDQVWLASP